MGEWYFVGEKEPEMLTKCLVCKRKSCCLGRILPSKADCQPPAYSVRGKLGSGTRCSEAWAGGHHPHTVAALLRPWMTVGHSEASLRETV